MDDILKHAKECYNEIAADYERVGYYKTYPLNEFWGSSNLRTMRNLILSAQTTQDIIHGAQRTFMFCVNSTERDITQRAVHWLLDERVERLRLYGWLTDLEESELSLPENNVAPTGRRLNPDFLRCVNIVAEIYRNLCIGDRALDVIELGGGLGHLARVMRMGTLARSHVIIDIPETLVFSYCFLRENFPAAKCVWLKPGQELPAVYDFAFVPAMLADQVTWRPFDLFVNTASMGEMRNSVIRHWMDFIQKRLNVKYLFTLNRFLNTIHERLRWRLEENECSVHYDAGWKILDWELEPSYTRCPYVDTRVSRYVQIVAEKGALAREDAVWRVQHFFDAVASEDWARLWHEGHVMGMRDGPICVNGTMSGTLFKLWELMRLRPTAKTCELMLKYLAKITPAQPGMPVMFEEMGYYEKLHRDLSLVSSVLERVS